MHLKANTILKYWAILYFIGLVAALLVIEVYTLPWVIEVYTPP
jgi:hypothetical protein